MTDRTGIEAEIAASHKALPETILEVDNLGVEFWVEGEFYPAAIDMNYVVRRGEVLAIVGESGSGKSTSSMALLGLLPENARVTGSIKLLGRGAARRRRRDAARRCAGNEIAPIFQEPMTALNPVYTIGFQIMEALRSHDRGMAPSVAKERAIELLRLVEMPNPEQSFNKYPHQLSGGQRQRAMIAQSISCDPLLLIADEPTTALDVTVQAEILDLLRNLHKRLDSAIILITHDMGVVADLADRIMVMKNGEVVESGPSSRSSTPPQHPYTQQLLASVPHLGLGVLEEASLEAGGRRETDTSDGAGDRARSASAPPRWPTQTVTRPATRCCRSRMSRSTTRSAGAIPAFRAAEHIDLQIYPGEILGLVGESGSGKTTLGRAAIGLHPDRRGHASTAVGTDISAASPQGAVRDPAHDRHRLPGPGVVAEPAHADRSSRSASRPARRRGEGQGPRQARGDAARPRWSCRAPTATASRTSSPAVSVSASASPARWRSRRELLVADEPTSALDVSVQARFLDLLQELQQQLQFACLFISHDLAVVDIWRTASRSCTTARSSRSARATRSCAEPQTRTRSG